MARKRTLFQTQFKQLFLPVIILLALLPVLVAAVVYGFSNVLLPKAATPSQVRLWVAPSTVIVRSGQSVSFKIYAAVEPKTLIIPSLRFSFSHGPQVSISPSTMVYNQPLQGQAIVGEILVTAGTKGQYDVGVSKDSVTISGDSNPNISVTSATVIVQ